MKLSFRIFTACLTLTFYCRAQEQVKEKVHAVHLMTGYSNFFNGLLITPAFGIEKMKSHLYFGPTLFLALGDNPSTSKNLALTGIHASYQHYPTKSERKLNLYLQGDLVLQRRKEDGSSNIFNAQSSTFQPFDFKRVNSYVQIYIGYGLRWALTESLFFTQSIGIGPAITFSNTESDFDNVSDTFIDVDWLLKFGLVKSFHK